MRSVLFTSSSSASALVASWPRLALGRGANATKGFAPFSSSLLPAASNTVPLRPLLKSAGDGGMIPAVGMGSSDGAIFEPAERADNIFSGVVRSGRRLVMFDAESCVQQLSSAASATTGGSKPSMLRKRPHWERNAMTRILASKAVTRDQLVVGAAFLGSDASGLHDKLKSFLAELSSSPSSSSSSSSYVDLLVLEMTNSDQGRTDEEIMALFAAAEAAVEQGLARAYGIHARDWHPLEAAEGNSTVNGGTSLRRMFKLLRAAAQSRSDTTNSSSSVNKDRSKQHNCVAIASPASLHAPGILLPTVVDAQGKQWSVADLAGKLGLASIVTAPLDCLLPAQELEQTLLRLEEERLNASRSKEVSVYPPQRGSNTNNSSNQRQRVAPPSPADSKRPFRCVDTPLHRDSHPSRLAALLNDIVNFAIHCELMWERQVKALVAQERAVLDKAEGLEAHADAAEGVDASVARSSPIPPSSSDVTNTDQGEGARKRPSLRVEDLEPSDVCWAQMLVQRLEHPGFLTLMEWHHVRNNRIVPALTRLAAATQGIDGVREWSQCYRGLITELMNKVDLIVEQAHGHQAAWLAQQLEGLITQQPAVGDKPQEQAAAAPSASSSASELTWARKASSLPLQQLVQRLFLASSPHAIVISEVPEFHAIATKASTRVSVEAEAAAVGASASSDEQSELPELTQEVAQRVLSEAVKSRLVMRAATMALPDWEDPLKDVPVQAELAPLQESIRRMMRASHDGHDGDEGNDDDSSKQLR